MKKGVIIILILFLIPIISSTCEDNQININTASLTDLTQIINIGEKRAETLISLRPFESINNLININGIGPTYLEEIKTQNLACVEEEQETSSEDIEEQTPKKTPEQENTQETTNNLPKTITSQTIKLNSESQKTIKTENNSEDSNKNKLTIYGLIAFCILLTFLFLIKKKTYKNEFRE